MTDREMVLEETRRILARLPRPMKKKRRFTPDPAMTRKLTEAGFSPSDAITLQEAHQHEVAAARDWGAPVRIRVPEMDSRKRAALDVLQEQEQSSALAPPTDWTESSTGSFTHAKAPGHRLMIDGAAWSHRLPNGQIRRRGQGQQSLAEYAKKVAETGGNTSAADGTDAVSASESLVDVARRRALGDISRPSVESVRLMEAIRIRHTTGTPSASRDDLRERMRKLVTR